MKYIIDPTIPFEGTVVTSMSDDIHSDYGGETLEALKKAKDNPNLIAVTPERVAELVNEHRAMLNKAPFEEIDEERYYDVMDCLPPARMLHNAFFVGECYQYDLYPFCFKIGGRFFEGRRAISTPKEVLYTEIKDFFDNLIKSETDGN
ncbi:hypothetical protein E4T81_12060 [Barnesiella sp. WM24]|uniref:hypothetical protein n=1 Tax=Barnesiella sp. WM24 TaxID=2558278 RepID=UPI001072AA9A|nr:hypothetical protein [Barnesiella sp. WM24]TFU92317.1 hypothetical protein E4T81_12060 [Barnesiella sp. WM24]